MMLLELVSQLNYIIAASFPCSHHDSMWQDRFKYVTILSVCHEKVQNISNLSLLSHTLSNVIRMTFEMFMTYYHQKNNGIKRYSVTNVKLHIGKKPCLKQNARSVLSLFTITCQLPTNFWFTLWKWIPNSIEVLKYHLYH